MQTARITSTCQFLALRSCPVSRVRWGIGPRKFTARCLNLFPLRCLTQNTCPRVESYLTRDIMKYNHTHSVSHLLIDVPLRSVSLVTCLVPASTHVHQKYFNILCVGEGKSVLLQAWTGPEGSMNLGFPDYITTTQDGGKFVNLTHRPPLPPGNTPGTHFC